jgi:Spy/CpxP family protein refolding chaperone
MIWSVMVSTALCAVPALAQAPTNMPRADARPEAQAPAAPDNPAALAAGDQADEDLLASLIGEDGPLEAPMPGDGPGMDGPPRGSGMRGGMGMRGNWGMMASQLDLTDAQREKIRGIMETQMRRGIQERADLQIAALDLGKLMRADTPNRGEIDAQVDKMARMRASLSKERIGAMLDSRAVLTPEQRDKLKQMRSQGWGGRHGGHGHGGPGGPGGSGGPGDGDEQ